MPARQRRPYSLVRRKRFSRVYAYVFLLGSLSLLYIPLVIDRAKQLNRPQDIPMFLAVGTLIWMLGMTSFLSHWRRQFRARITITAEGITQGPGQNQKWTLAWSEVKTVTFRRYSIPWSYFDEAILLKPTNGNTRLIPTSSVMYGKMPYLDDLIADIQSRGVTVNKEH